MEDNQIISFKINLSKIDKNKIFVGEKGKYLNVTVCKKREIDRYGYTHTMYITPTKLEAEFNRHTTDKLPRTYLGDGKIMDFLGLRAFDPQKDLLPF